MIFYARSELLMQLCKHLRLLNLKTNKLKRVSDFSWYSRYLPRYL